MCRFLGVQNTFIPLYLFTASKRATTATTDYDTSRRPSLPSRTSFVNMSVLNQGEREKLIAARDILELGLQNMSSAREATALTDGKSIADIGWVKVGKTTYELLSLIITHRKLTFCNVFKLYFLDYI